MNTLEKWCKHLNIAIDEKQKIVFWEKHDELKLGIINAELQEAFTFKEIPLIEIETTRNKHFHSQSLWDNIENENFRNASWESAPITELADTLVSESIELNASDLHLETLENAIKGGRINALAGRLINALNFKVIVKIGNGEVKPFDKARGDNNSMKKVVENVCSLIREGEVKSLAIAHSNCLEKALKVKEMILKNYNFENVTISEIGPSMGSYTAKGAILISVL